MMLEYNSEDQREGQDAMSLGDSRQVELNCLIMVLAQRMTASETRPRDQSKTRNESGSIKTRSAKRGRDEIVEADSFRAL